MADPGFPVGGRGPRRRGRGPPRRLCFKNFVCQNKRTWTRRGGRAPLDPPMPLIFIGVADIRSKGTENRDQSYVYSNVHPSDKHLHYLLCRHMKYEDIR